MPVGGSGVEVVSEGPEGYVEDSSQPRQAHDEDPGSLGEVMSLTGQPPVT